MAPSGEAYNIDWVVSTGSNVHVANDRAWFTSFTPFETYLGTYLSSKSRIEVAGIGTVELNVKLRTQKRGHQTNTRIITLRDVLYAPHTICNIFGLPEHSDYNVELDFSQKCGSLIDIDGNRAGLVQFLKLPRLRLHAQRGTSSLEDGVAYMINAQWSDTERARWEAHQTQQLSASVSSNKADVPYTTEEKAWLKKHYGGEYKFLRSFGLSIYKEEDRTDGRHIARRMMAEDVEESKGSHSQMQDTSMRETVYDDDNGDDDDDDNDDDDEYSSDIDADNFLKELESDPMSHLADSNFSHAELKWIQKHYQYSSNFMLSYGLKPFDQEDCDEAQSIIRALMDTD
jgi:hypothetical protein